MLTSFSYARLSNVSEHEIDDWHLWSVFGDIDRSRYNCSFDTIRDRVYFIPGYNVIRSSILLFTHDLTRLNYSRRERTIDIPTLVKIFYNRNRGKESLDKDPSFAVPINEKNTIIHYSSLSFIRNDPIVDTNHHQILVQRDSRNETVKRRRRFNCSDVAGLRATKVSHGALPFRHDDRCAHLAVLLRLDAALSRDPSLHVLGEQGRARARPGDDTEACVQHRRAHRHRHWLNALARPVLPRECANPTLIVVAHYRLKLQFMDTCGTCDRRPLNVSSFEICRYCKWARQIIVLSLGQDFDNDNKREWMEMPEGGEERERESWKRIELGRED